VSAPELRVGSGVRASDGERERIAQILQGAAAEGRLSPEEAGERLAAASAATYREELQQLIGDLPVASEHSALGPLVRRGRGAGGAIAWWLWSAARTAFLVMLIIGVASWGLRFFWPWGVLAVVLLSRPWRRHWRAAAWRSHPPGWARG
jgi:uncharacterized protein DUF1707